MIPQPIQQLFVLSSRCNELLLMTICRRIINSWLLIVYASLCLGRVCHFCKYHVPWTRTECKCLQLPYDSWKFWTPMFMLLLLSECSKVHPLGQDVLILKYQPKLSYYENWRQWSEGWTCWDILKDGKYSYPLWFLQYWPFFWAFTSNMFELVVFWSWHLIENVARTTNYWK